MGSLDGHTHFDALPLRGLIGGQSPRNRRAVKDFGTDALESATVRGEAASRFPSSLDCYREDRPLRGTAESRQSLADRYQAWGVAEKTKKQPHAK
jgi:hypothetical protein